jgi:hypothetical protein
MGKAIGFQVNLGEDRDVRLGYEKESGSFVLQFATPLPNDGRPKAEIITKHREATVQLEGENIMVTNIKLSKEAFGELIRLGMLIDEATEGECFKD